MPCHHCRKALLPLIKFFVQRDGERVIICGIGKGDIGELPRMEDWQPSHNVCIGNAENCSVASNPNRKNNDCRERKARSLPEHSDAVPEVLQPRFKRWECPHPKAYFSRSSRVAEGQQCASVRILRQHPRRDVFLGLKLDVGADLLLEIAIHRTLVPDYSPQARGCGSPGHDHSCSECWT